MSFEHCVAIIIDIEGGDEVTNDPDDPGGLTKFGVSKRSFPHLDIANLTYLQAVEVYRKEFWDKVHGDQLPVKLALCVFDCAVNQGFMTARMILQATVKIPTDGFIGPRTLEAIRRYPEDYLVTDFLARRALRYAETGGFQKYGRGWMRRLFEIAMRAGAFAPAIA